jgi:hypothetical protein
MVRKCEESYDISNKKYCDSVWKQKLWRQTGEELKNQVNSNVFIANFEVTIILIISKQRKMHSVAVVQYGSSHTRIEQNRIE